MVSGCNKFYYIVKDDTCYNIATRWGIPLETLYIWNPDLHTDCTGLLVLTRNQKN
ncbi:hypothetical protein F4810DRAFT_691337 [Camillea tinctor]|nr:hypothetical protein F4810DRAFT_691337 [Camillea tinctor]